MNCQDLITREPIYLKTSDTVTKAADMMERENVGFLPICSEDKHVVGVITDRDLALRILAHGRSPEIPVEQIATKEVVSCTMSTPIDECRDMISNSSVGRLVVVTDDGVLAGVISLADIAQAAPKDESDGLRADVSQREVL